MKLRLEELGCRLLNLESGEEPNTTLRLSEICDGSGELSFLDGLTILDDLAIRSLLAELSIPLPGGAIRTSTPASFSHLTFAGRIRNGLAGELRASVVQAEGIYAQSDTFALSGDLSAEGLLLKIDGRGGRVEVGTLTMANAQWQRGDLVINLDSLSLFGLKAEWGTERKNERSPAQFMVEARKANAKGLRVFQAGTQVETSSIDLPDGFSVKDEIALETLIVDSTDLLFQRSEKEESEDSGNEDAEAANGKPALIVPPIREAMSLDHGVFDTVNGKLQVDATAVVTLPVIGKRNATHYFRLPIEGGMINIDHFEDGLAGLEDAFLDIRLRDDRLVLERDIPLIPGLDRPLVIWKLGRGERELASRRLVRLRTLMGYELAVTPTSPDPNKKSKARFHGLDLDKIEVQLSLDETKVLRSGEGDIRAHVDELELSGNLSYSLENGAGSKQSQLQMRANGLGAVAKDFDVAGRQLQGTLTGDIDQFHLLLDGFRPSEVKMKIKRAVLASFRLSLVDSLSPRKQNPSE